MNKKIINKKNNAGASAVIGVILMVAITVAISATIYVYVSNMMNDDRDIESEIEDLFNDKFNFTDGYQLYNVYFEQLYFDLYEVDIMLVNGDEPIRDIFGILINLDNDKIYFEEFSNFIEYK